MKHPKATFAVYGIQDRDEYNEPRYVHDHSLCIMQDGRVRDFLQLERLSGTIRDNRLYAKLSELVHSKQLENEDFDLVFVDSIVGRSFITSQGNVRFEAPMNRILAADKEEGQCWWFGRKVQAWALNHELAHVFSCLPFYGNFKPNSLLVHFDGGASQSNFSAWLYKANKLVKISAHWDYKFLTSIFNANALVFAATGSKADEPNNVPEKFIALAKLGNHRFELETWLREHDFFENIWGKEKQFLAEVKNHWHIDLRAFDAKNPFIQDCMATLHEIFVRESLLIFKRLQRETLTRNLYYSGGCALNSTVNSRILQEKLFDSVFIPPCSDDTGLALGAAAYLEWQKNGRVYEHRPFLNNWNLPDEVQFSGKEIKKVADAILSGKVVGVCNGFGEAGSRSFGNRSLLALADDKAIAQKLCVEHKGLEWFQSLSPVVLEKNLPYFTAQKKIHALSRFKLLDLPVSPKKRKELAGAMNADGTTRIQVLFERGDNPFLWDLLHYLNEHHQLKALINTEFSGKDMPLVHTEDDALRTAKAMGIPYLITNGKIRELTY